MRYGPNDIGYLTDNDGMWCATSNVKANLPVSKLVWIGVGHWKAQRRKF